MWINLINTTQTCLLINVILRMSVDILNLAQHKPTGRSLEINVECGYKSSLCRTHQKILLIVTGKLSSSVDSFKSTRLTDEAYVEQCLVNRLKQAWHRI